LIERNNYPFADYWFYRVGGALVELKHRWNSTVVDAYVRTRDWKGQDGMLALVLILAVVILTSILTIMDTRGISQDNVLFVPLLMVLLMCLVVGIFAMFYAEFSNPSNYVYMRMPYRPDAEIDKDMIERELEEALRLAGGKVKAEPPWDKESSSGRSYTFPNGPEVVITFRPDQQENGKRFLDMMILIRKIRKGTSIEAKEIQDKIDRMEVWDGLMEFVDQEIYARDEYWII